MVEPYQHKPGSRESGSAWETIAQNLRKTQTLRFSVTQRLVRDRFRLLQNRFKISQNRKLTQSGINPEPTEVDVALEDISERMSVCIESQKTETQAKKDQVEKKKKSAEEIRKKAMESLGQTKKRKIEQGASESKKSRRSGNDTVQFLREKAELDRETKKEELRLKEVELQMRRDEQKAIAQGQIQQQQQMQQTFSLLATQQQKILDLMMRMSNK